MDQDVLTNGALGALWRRDQVRRMSLKNKTSGRCSPQTPQQQRHHRFPATTTTTTNNAGLIKNPGFLVDCISPKKSSDSLGFPRLQFSGGQKRKQATNGTSSTVSWPQLQKVSSSSSWSSLSSLTSPRCGPPPAKKTKFNLKEMAEQFTASQVELVARKSFMLPPGRDGSSSSSSSSSEDKDNTNSNKKDGSNGHKSACTCIDRKKLPGISESINIFLNPQKSDVDDAEASTIQEEEEQEQAEEQRESCNMDMSCWGACDLDPTPILEPTAASTTSLLLQLEPTPIVEPTPIFAEPTPIKEGLSFMSSSYTCNTIEEQPSSSSSLLHQTIRLFSTNYDLVKNALELNLKDIRCKSPLVSSSSSNTTESYGYPLNVAIVNDSSLDVLELLVNAAPDVITSPDGYDNDGSLFLVLENANKIKFPLLQVVQLLIKANPKSLLQTNSKGETILQVAQRTLLPKDSNVFKFLEQAYKNQEL